jgi:murein DD-endopeptidase MepM/ murein hydrolase activator NlpD
MLQAARIAFITTVCFASFGPGGSTAFAQTGQNATRKTTATRWTQYKCTDGIQLRMSSADPTQGSLEIIELRSPHQLNGVAGKWDGKDIPFWQVLNTAQKAVDAKRAFIGIDLEHPTGQFEFTVSAKTSDGNAFTCPASLTVKAGRFATEKLNVAPQFVEPDPEQLTRANEERKRLREIFATVTPEKFWSGPFRVPLTGVTTGGNFGKRRILNGEPSSPHTGIDFPAATGTPVHATQRGRVVLAEPLYFSGNTVILDHGLGVYTLYGHLSAFDVKTGEMVDAGDLLGKVGATGRVTGPHLHWGLTVNTARVNSLDIVKLP